MVSTDRDLRTLQSIDLQVKATPFGLKYSICCQECVSPVTQNFFAFL